MQERKKVLIVSTDSFLVYQPTILNLYNALKEHFDVSIVSFRYYNRFMPVSADYQVTYLAPPKFLKKLLFLLNMPAEKLLNPALKVFSKRLAYRNNLFKKLISSILKRHLRAASADEVIAVDFQAMAACTEVFGGCHFLSLEIYPDDPYKKKVAVSNIKSVIISSEERYELLFGQAQLKTFFIQNAPNYKAYTLAPPAERKGLIWAGTIDPKFGVEHLIKFVAQHPQYTLTLKGSFVSGAEAHIRSAYSALLAEGRLAINTDYLDNDAFIRFVSGFRIGFCFYEWSLIRTNINYYLGNAGRLFMYFAASVPAIACNTPGLKSIREFNAGRLIDDYEPDTILNAVQEIEMDYESISANCTRAAKHFSFDRAVIPLIEFLKTR